MSVEKPDKKIRQLSGRATEDAQSIANINYNEASGGTKNLSVGPFLKPLRVGNTYTTDATTAKSVRKGTSLAIWNDSGAVGSITLGDSNAVTSLGHGVTDANGNVGIPMKPQDWTYINTYEKQWVIASAATLKVFIIEDETYISSQKQG